jgi:hypothetical protein
MLVLEGHDNYLTVEEVEIVIAEAVWAANDDGKALAD